MRKLLFSLAFMMSVTMMADDKVVSSPDGRLVVTISCNDGAALLLAPSD